ncbi:type II toxin-antitoxin system RelE/ParE family toxin [Imperialibacter roseus]|uniref:Type II toxin-antitoxin system RelE/ParE family toxin n=1 Tax=Imperialibacter roseus TaxID=1324217 RepID=A0ABZ0IMW6_9BACT|nr:type II toxin-antitoxin system RelE/ParE family toxin [Imperialibacter roseus]WOK05504.1 type II toxin-antitoxin system RelE/ParE family toxin [Imperialibacter roseus]
MTFKVIWSHSAENRLIDIYNYYSEKASPKIAKKLVRELIQASINLKHTPFIGQIEPLLTHRSNEYRYLVVRSYKIIYSPFPEIGEIQVADVFDCRQNPEKIKRAQ